MKKHSIGIMQGRLTPSQGKGIQFFPFDLWKQEFESADKVGLSEIEFIFDYEKYEMNPLWTEEGVGEIRRMIEQTGISVHSVCFDYFMRRAFFKRSLEEQTALRNENMKIAVRVLNHMSKLGATLLEIPLVDDSSLKTEEEKRMFRLFLAELLEFKPAEIKISLETDLPPQEFRLYLDCISHPQVGANYDSGNSSGIGYNCKEEIRSLDKYISNVHIKDRKLNGSTVELGTGNADFDTLFSELKRIGYEGSFILQAARREDFQEEHTIGKQKQFVENYLLQYYK